MGAHHGAVAYDSHLQLSFLADLIDEFDANEELKKVGTQPRKKRKSRARSSSSEEVQLEFSWEAFAADVLSADEHLPSNFDEEEWTQEEVVALHLHLLEQSLSQALNPRSSRSLRLEVLRWVDRTTPYQMKSPAFSFDKCCQLAAYDSDELRDHLHDEMRFRGIHPNT